MAPLTVQAATNANALIKDETGMISDSELQRLNEYALKISNDYRIQVSYLIPINTAGQTMRACAEERFPESGRLWSDGFVLVHDVDGKRWDVVCFGVAERFITDEEIDLFWTAYDLKGTNYDGVWSYLEVA